MKKTRATQPPAISIFPEYDFHPSSHPRLLISSFQRFPSLFPGRTNAIVVVSDSKNKGTHRSGSRETRTTDRESDGARIRVSKRLARSEIRCSCLVVRAAEKLPAARHIGKKESVSLAWGSYLLLRVLAQSVKCFCTPCNATGCVVNFKARKIFHTLGFFRFA